MGVGVAVAGMGVLVGTVVFVGGSDVLVGCTTTGEVGVGVPCPVVGLVMIIGVPIDA